VSSIAWLVTDLRLGGSAMITIKGASSTTTGQACADQMRASARLLCCVAHGPARTGCVSVAQNS
jgi:hypothetical protein